MLLIERYGVDTIPETDRTSSPWDIVSILIGSNLCFGVIIFGWLPVSFGLGWWGSISSLISGTLIGAALVAPLSLISLKTATNLSTSSGAAFGVRGRLIGSSIGLLLSLGYIALTLWTGGEIVMEVLARLMPISRTNATYCTVYTFLALFTVIGAIYGYCLLLRLSKLLAVVMLILLLFGLVAYYSTFTTAAHSQYLLGSFWPTWLLSTVSAGLSGPIAFITLLGDYSRYISSIRHSSRNVLWATYFGLLVGLLIPQLFGTFIALASNAASTFSAPLVSATPFWYLLPLLLAATLGSIGNGGVMLYSMGLDLDAILPCSTRIKATWLVAIAAIILVFLGHFISNAQQAMTSFVLMLTAIGAPWAVIILISHARCKGQYDGQALQAFNARLQGGIYWYYAGWNIQATLAWALGAIIGLLSISTPIYEGPLMALSGIDLSFILSGITAGIMYLILISFISRRIKLISWGGSKLLN